MNVRWIMPVLGCALWAQGATSQDGHIGNGCAELNRRVIEQTTLLTAAPALVNIRIQNEVSQSPPSGVGSAATHCYTHLLQPSQKSPVNLPFIFLEDSVFEPLHCHSASPVAA